MSNVKIKGEQREKKLKKKKAAMPIIGRSTKTLLLPLINKKVLQNEKDNHSK